LRIGVGIKKRRRHDIGAGPETEAAHFLRICFARDRIRQVRNPARMRRRRSPGKSCHGKIETAPEKMNRTALSEQARSKILKPPIRLNKSAPESVRVFRIVSAMLLVFVERNRIRNLVRDHVDLYRQVQSVERLLHRLVKICYASRLERDHRLAAV